MANAELSDRDRLLAQPSFKAFATRCDDLLDALAVSVLSADLLDLLVLSVIPRKEALEGKILIQVRPV